MQDNVQRTYTEDEFQRMATAQYAAGLAAAMKAAGFAPPPGEPFKAQLAALGEHAQAMRAEAEAGRAQAEGMRRRVSAIEKGVPADRADRYARLAQTYEGDGVDYEAALAAALEEFPVEQAERETGPRVVASAKGVAGERRWREMTLGERGEMYRRDAEGARRLAALDGERL